MAEVFLRRTFYDVSVDTESDDDQSPRMTRSFSDGAARASTSTCSAASLRYVETPTGWKRLSLDIGDVDGGDGEGAGGVVTSDEEKKEEHAQPQNGQANMGTGELFDWPDNRPAAMPAAVRPACCGVYSALVGAYTPVVVLLSPAHAASAHLARTAVAGADTPCSDRRTTLVLRNLPRQLGRDEILHRLDQLGFCGRYNFVYLPHGVRTLESLGFCFVNFETPEDAHRGRARLDGFSMWGVPGERRPCAAGWASSGHQGLRNNIARYQTCPMMVRAGVPEWCKPVVLQHGTPMPFPMPDATTTPLPGQTMGRRRGRRADLPSTR